MDEHQYDASDDSALFSVRLRRRQTSCMQYRYQMVFLLFCGIFLAYSMRVNVSVAIVAMVNNTAVEQNGTTPATMACTDMIFNSSTTNETYLKEDGELVWDKVTRGYVLQAFSYGYVATQLPGGWLAGVVNNKWLFGVSIFLTSLLTFLTAPVARWNLYAFYVLRALDGLTQGVIYPSLYALLASWVPAQERSLLTTICNSGALIGTMVTFPLATFLCEHGYDGGWPSFCYGIGSFGCMWFVIWAMIASAAPEKHQGISISERDYIIENRGADFAGQKKVPWASILTSRAVWVYTLAKFCASWSFYILLIALPIYVRNVLRLETKNNGYLSSAISIAQFVSAVIFSYVADRLTEYKAVTVTKVRKVYFVAAMIAEAACLVGMAKVGCDILAACLLLLTASAISGVVFAADAVLPLDLAPRFAGSVIGLANMAANVAIVLAPLVVGYLTESNESLWRWDAVFYITAGIDVLGGLAFLFLGDAAVQLWATVRPEEEPAESPDADRDANTGGESAVCVY